MRSNRLFFLVLLVLSAILLRSCLSPYEEENLVFTRDYFRSLNSEGSIALSEVVLTETRFVCVFNEYDVFPREMQNEPGFGTVPNQDVYLVGEHENLIYYFDGNGAYLGHDRMRPSVNGANPGWSDEWNKSSTFGYFKGCARPEMLSLELSKNCGTRECFRIMERISP